MTITCTIMQPNHLAQSGRSTWECIVHFQYTLHIYWRTNQTTRNQVGVYEWRAIMVYSDFHHFALANAIPWQVKRHNPPLPGLPVHVLPVLNPDQTDHNIKLIEHWCAALVAPGGVLRFGLVGDVPPAARDPYPLSGVIYPKKGTHVLGFAEKKYPFLAFFSKFSGVHIIFCKSDP